MPNWCQNKLTVTGNANLLTEFAKENAAHLSKADAMRAVEEKDGTLLLKQDLNDAIQSAPDLETLAKELSAHPQPLSCESLVPTPPRLLEGNGWYMWRVENWGTKWDLSFGSHGIVLSAHDLNESALDGSVNIMPSLESSNRTLLYDFDTAWSPPMEWFEILAEKWPDLHFVLQFAECGMEFAGRSERCISKNIIVDKELSIDEALPDDERYF